MARMRELKGREPRGAANGGAGGFLGSLVPLATWLNPHSTTGCAVEVSKFFNIQFWGQLISRLVAMGMSVEDAYRAQGTD
jgi:hypothetical protein